MITTAWSQDLSLDSTNDLDILVRYKTPPGILPDKQIAQSMGYRQVHSFKRFDIVRLRQEETGSLSLEKALKELRDDPSIEWAEPNYPRYAHKLPNDPLFENQWHLLNTGQSGGAVGADIGAVGSWDITTGSQVTVALLDTGIDYTHQDLKENIWRNPGEDWLSNGSPGFNGIDDDGNGYVDDYYGINVVDESPQPPFLRRVRDPIDTDGHGTHVAGIIGAVGNNAVGISGINWNVELMSLKFLGPQGGDIAGVIECVNYILDQKAKGIPIYIVNASYGGSSYSEFEKEAYEALRDSGILLVVSAGNSSSDLDKGESNFPSNYNLENMINVAATTRSDSLATFSNFGRVSVHLGAPGSQILSTFPNNTYEIFGGTSMSAPQVSGALALIYSSHVVTMLEAKERIFRGVDQLESLSGKVFTNGRLNVQKALTAELKGPFIFSVSPLSGSPGTIVTLTGVRFGSRTSDSRVLFSGIEAPIIGWSDHKIDFRVPEDGLDNEIQVVAAEGASNTLLFSSQEFYRYYLPFAPAQNPWTSFLVLTNFSDRTINVKVYASKAGAFVQNIFLESLLPQQVVYRKLNEYGLEDLNNLLWVESENHITVGAVVSFSNGGLMDFSYIRALSR